MEVLISRVFTLIDVMKIFRIYLRLSFPSFGNVPWWFSLLFVFVFSITVSVCLSIYFFVSYFYSIQLNMLSNEYWLAMGEWSTLTLILLSGWYCLVQMIPNAEVWLNLTAWCEFVLDKRLVLTVHGSRARFVVDDWWEKEREKAGESTWFGRDYCARSIARARLSRHTIQTEGLASKQQKIQMLNAADEICARARKQSSASPVSR